MAGVALTSIHDRDTGAHRARWDGRRRSLVRAIGPTTTPPEVWTAGGFGGAVRNPGRPTPGPAGSVVTGVPGEPVPASGQSGTRRSAAVPTTAPEGRTRPRRWRRRRARS